MATLFLLIDRKNDDNSYSIDNFLLMLIKKISGDINEFSENHIG